MAVLLSRQNTKFIDDRAGFEATARDRFVANQLADLIANKDFPCVGAKSALAKDAFQIGIYNGIADFDETAVLYEDLGSFVGKVGRGEFAGEFSTFVAIFDTTETLSEAQFHEALWSNLSTLAQLEPVDRIVPADISENVEAPNFSFCIHGTPFFIVGLHPTASRYSRRFAYPTLVFNRHEQFDSLRRTGRFEKMQSTIRRRDIEVQGNLNPNLANFGQASEALQYSGLPNVTPARCPFHPSGEQ